MYTTNTNMVLHIVDCVLRKLQMFYLQTMKKRACPCGWCEDPNSRDREGYLTPAGCCRCGCPHGGHCYSFNLYRYRCCPKCPIPCYDYDWEKSRCCPDCPDNSPFYRWGFAEKKVFCAGDDPFSCFPATSKSQTGKWKIS